MQAGTGPAHIFPQGAGRPPSSAWRPGTAARPGTSFGQGQHGHGGYDIQPGAGAEPMMEQEIYEESEDEDVFAFLPPSTADANAEQQQQETQGAFMSTAGVAMAADQTYYYPQQHQHNPFAHDPARLTSKTSSRPETPEVGSDPSHHHPFGSTTAEYSQSYPYAYAYEPEAAAQFASASLAPEAYFAQTQASFGGIHASKQTQVHQPPQSPPSTDSQPSTGYGMAGHDAYKLKRLSAAPLGERDIGVTSVVDEEEEVDSRTSLSNPSPAPSASRRGEEVMVSLPGVGKKSLDREKDKFVSREVAADLERGTGGGIAMKDDDARPDNRARQRGRNKSARKSGSNPVTGGESGVTAALATEEGLRKRSRNMNAGPYYAYERFTHARNGRGKIFYTLFLIYLFI